MNSLDDQLIVLRNEIDDLFFNKFGKRSNDKTGKEIKFQLFGVAKALRSIEKEENLNFEILGTYLYYLRYHFLNLWESLMKIMENNTDVYQQLCQKKDFTPIEYFFKYGFFCYLFMTSEIQKTIFDEKRYDLFWDQLYHFWNYWEFGRNKNRLKTLNNLISEIGQDKIYFNAAITNFLLKEKKQIKFEGRPSKVTFEIILKFADLLEENRSNKKCTMRNLMETAVQKKMDWTTLRNWLRNYKPKLKNPPKSNRDLTKDNMLFMWEVSQKDKMR